jgi:hypothetical protein
LITTGGDALLHELIEFWGEGDVQTGTSGHTDNNGPKPLECQFVLQAHRTASAPTIPPRVNPTSACYNPPQVGETFEIVPATRG